MYKINVLSNSISYRKDVEAFITEWLDGSEFITVHTSGSTGKPKEISLEKAKMRVSALATGRFFGFAPKWHLCSPLPVRYIAGKMMIVRALEWDLSLDILEPQANPLKEISRTYDFMVMTPHQLMTGLQSRYSENTQKINKLLLGGSPITKELNTKIQKLTPEVYIGYGMTETMSHVALRSLNKTNRSNYYTAVENIHFSVDSRDCLKIHSSHLLGEPLQTNDVVSLKSNTEFLWRGRYDHVINTGGIKVFPLEIENKIQALITAPYYISFRHHSSLGQQIVLRINDKAWSAAKESKIIDEMKSILTSYEMPKQIIYDEQFQFTKNGKLIRL